MKILVIGGSGREHALCWKLAQGGAELVCAPGNAGIAGIARCLPLDVASVADTLALAAAEQPDLVVIGPEIPLAAGVVDALQAAGVRVFGPTQAAARLETSKAFAKDFMRRWAIPTAAYAVCDSAAEVAEALPKFAQKVVLKADGLAAGKGVLLCETHADALAAADDLFSGKTLGTPAASLVLEEMLTGPEVSFFALCDGQHACLLGLAQDHKRIGEGDTGPNTGGMGAYSTDDLLPATQVAEILKEVAQRAVDGMRAEETPFTGVLFIGLMMTPMGPRVLEFNTRFGDPETEAILLRLETSLAHLLEAALDGRLAQTPILLNPQPAACVIAASAGYPGKYPIGLPITGLDAVSPEVKVFHAGTALAGRQVVSTGGRVLAVSARGDTLQQALDAAYAALLLIHFEGMQYRRDIGYRALLRGAAPV